MSPASRALVIGGNENVTGRSLRGVFGQGRAAMPLHRPPNPSRWPSASKLPLHHQATLRLPGWHYFAILAVGLPGLARRAFLKSARLFPS
jgi:hypothetical protein